MYKGIAELMEAYQNRRIFPLVKGLPPTERTKTYLMGLVEMRCPAIDDATRGKLMLMASEVNSEWASRMIDELKEHPKKHHRKCWRCGDEGAKHTAQTPVNNPGTTQRME